MSLDPRKLAGGYFLGFIFFLLVLLLWLRGMGRLLLPAMILGVIGYGVYWFVQKVREPVD